MGHWSFDEGTGTAVADGSGEGNHGTLVNARADTWATGMSGGGLHFDGTTGAGATYVNIPNSPSLQVAGAVSFAAWVRSEDTGRDAPILAKEGEGNLSYWFGAFGPGHFGVLLDLDGSQPWTIYDRDQGSLPDGLWAHIASTWDGATLRHYLNGVQLQETTPFAGPIHASDAALIVGANYPYNTTAFKGTVHEVRVYDHALSPDEIRALAGTTRRLVGHWAFDEGNGTRISDSSGLGNDGTLVNPQADTWTTGVQGGALYFGGVVGLDSTYVEVPDAPSLRTSGEVGFAAWVRCDDIHRDAPILAKEGDGKLSYWFGAFGLGFDGSGPGNFGMLLDVDGNQPWTTLDRDQGAIPEGEWVHLAGTWDGTTLRHYMNGEALTETGTFPGPIHHSDAFLAIGVNSVYNFAANHTAFKGAVDEVLLYNYALSAAEIHALYASSRFRISSVVREGDDLRLTWACVPGRRYEVQTSLALQDTAGFLPLSGSILIPEDFSGTTTNYLHSGALLEVGPRFYRIKLLP